MLNRFFVLLYWKPFLFKFIALHLLSVGCWFWRDGFWFLWPQQVFFQIDSYTSFSETESFSSLSIYDILLGYNNYFFYNYLANNLYNILHQVVFLIISILLLYSSSSFQ